MYIYLEDISAHVSHNLKGIFFIIAIINDVNLILFIGFMH